VSDGGARREHPTRGRLATLRYKWRYSPLPRLAIGALKRIGISVLPYYLFRRPLEPARGQPAGAAGDLVQLGADDMTAIASMPMANSAEHEYRARLSRGQRCYGLRIDGELVGYCWMDPQRCSFPAEDFTLPPGAAYAFDIYTVPSRRGENLAARLNALFHARMLDEGVDTMYSVVDYYNLPSLRFASKIGVRPLHLALYLRIFGLYQRTIVLRRYAPDARMRGGRPVTGAGGPSCIRPGANPDTGRATER